MSTNGNGDGHIANLFELYDNILDKVGVNSWEGQQVIEQFPKVITVAVASYLENETKEMLRHLGHEVVGDKGRLLINLIDKGILKRGYHTLFDWNQEASNTNANKFYKLFDNGEKKFSEYMKEKGEQNENFIPATRCFIEVGSKRNKLVHENFVAYSFDWTVKDIKEKYDKAKKFLPLFRDYALEFVG